MTTEEYAKKLKEALQGTGVKVKHVPPKKESSGPRKVKFVMVKKPRTPPPNPPSKSSDTQAND